MFDVVTELPAQQEVQEAISAIWPDPQPMKSNGCGHWRRSQSKESPMGWYALRVKSQREIGTARGLVRAGLSAWTPTRCDYRRANRFTRDKRPVSRALIPGYVLALLAEPVNWPWIMSLWPIYAVVGVDGIPAKVDPDSIDQLARMSTTAPPEARHMATGLEYQVGDTVEFIGGPMQGQQVVVEEITGKLARVGLRFLGASSIKVSVDALGKFG